MNSGKISSKEEKTKVFEMVLSSPGMAETCKISLKMTRQNVLLLGRLIESGILSNKGNFEDEVLGVLPEALTEEFKRIHGELLSKAGLTDFYEKLKSL